MANKSPRNVTILYDFPKEAVQEIAEALGGLSMSATVRVLVAEWLHRRTQETAKEPTQ